MDVTKIRDRVHEIRVCSDNPEGAHTLEDALYLDVLRAIADGAENPEELAREALLAAEIMFPRWCA